jgi:hypothetical protein
MKKILITFSGSAYDYSTQLIVERARKMGADDVWVYDDRWLIETDFWKLNGWLFDRLDNHGQTGRGFGWFCWKPFIILDALSRLNDGDIVLFTDADTYPVADFSVLFEECDRRNGMMLFSAVGCENQHWTKRDCLIVMGQDAERYRFCQHAVARFMLFQKGSWRVQQFLAEWLTYCLNPLAQTFDPSVILPEYPDLHQHRTEQSVFTLLAHKYGERLYREACQFGNSVDEDKDLYPQLFEQRGTIYAKNINGSAYRGVPGLI